MMDGRTSISQPDKSWTPCKVECYCSHCGKIVLTDGSVYASNLSKGKRKFEGSITRLPHFPADKSSG
uniref:Uncharacterized protein n=1 Tax=Rhizophora mucronata TaxID=61149 RepID=A0A2P2J557_RHIMU